MGMGTEDRGGEWGDWERGSQAGDTLDLVGPDSLLSQPDCKPHVCQYFNNLRQLVSS